MILKDLNKGSVSLVATLFVLAVKEGAPGRNRFFYEQLLSK